MKVSAENPKPAQKQDADFSIKSLTGNSDDAALTSFLDLMIDVFVETLGADRVSILLQDPTTLNLSIQASRGMAPQIVKSTLIRPGEGIAGLAVEERVPLIIRGDQKPEYLRVPLNHPELAASFIIPIYHEKRSLGAVCASTLNHPESFTPRNLDWMIEVCNRLSPVLLALQGQKKHLQMVQRLIRLVETINQLGNSKDEREAVQLALQCACKICTSQNCFFVPEREDSSTTELILTRIVGPSHWTAEEMEFFGSLGREAIAKKREVDLVVPLRAPLSVRKDLEVRGISRVMVFPILNTEKTFGCLYTFLPRGARETVRLLRFLVSHLIAAMSRTIHLRQLEHLAFMDELTEIYSRGYWMELFQEEFARADRLGLSLSVLLFDIDNFKACNDTYGHPVGDRVLKEIAQVIYTSARHFDSVCRFGGEEFTVLLPGVDQEPAFQIAERIRLNVASHSVISSGPGPERMTISGGIASFPRHASSIKQLLEVADKAMYRAKNLGRNKVCLPQKFPKQPALF